LLLGGVKPFVMPPSAKPRLAPVHSLKYESISTKTPLLTVVGDPVCLVICSEPEREPDAVTVPLVLVPGHLIVRAPEKVTKACLPTNDCFSTAAPLAQLSMPAHSSAAPNTKLTFTRIVASLI